MDLTTVSYNSDDGNMANVIKPPRFNHNDTIGLVVPAHSVRHPEHFIHTVEDFQNQGYKLKLASNIDTKYKNFAGTDSERAAGFMQVWEDPEVKVVWALKGGYGCQRILPLLDFEKIAANPKIFIGMSDITSLHQAIRKETNLVTFLGPNANHTFASNFAAESIFNLIAGGATPNADFQLPQTKTGWDLETLVGGKAIGHLVGGNLSSVAAHIGTCWQLEAEDKILVLEDCTEFNYRIDRYLVQLQQSNFFDTCKGVILCTWTDCCVHRHEGETDEILDDYFEKLDVPVLKGFPSGHITDQVSLPLNCLVELDSDKQNLKLLENPVV